MSDNPIPCYWFSLIHPSCKPLLCLPYSVWLVLTWAVILSCLRVMLLPLGMGETENREQHEVDLMLGLSWCAGLGQGRTLSSGWGTCVLAWWSLHSPLSPTGDSQEKLPGQQQFEGNSRDCELCRSVLSYQLIHYPAKGMPLYFSKSLFSLKAYSIAQIGSISHRLNILNDGSPACSALQRHSGFCGAF